VPRAGRAGLVGSRSSLRSYCSQVFRNANLRERLQKSVRASEFTFPGDPMRVDYRYRRNGTRGFVHTLSVSRAPGNAKLLAYTAEPIHGKGQFTAEFTAVTDMPLSAENETPSVRTRDTARRRRRAGATVWDLPSGSLSFAPCSAVTDRVSF
jgi:hypothetical protein